MIRTQSAEEVQQGPDNEKQENAAKESNPCCSEKEEKKNTIDQQSLSQFLISYYSDFNKLLLLLFRLE